MSNNEIFVFGDTTIEIECDSKEAMKEIMAARKKSPPIPAKQEKESHILAMNSDDFEY